MAKIISLPEVEEFLPDRPRMQLLYDSAPLRLVMFCLKAGQEIPPHEAPSEVMMLAVSGAGQFTVGAEREEVKAGSLVVCPAGVAHGMKATEDMVVLAAVCPRPGGH